MWSNLTQQKRPVSSSQGSMLFGQIYNKTTINYSSLESEISSAITKSKFSLDVHRLHISHLNKKTSASNTFLINGIVQMTFCNFFLNVLVSNKTIIVDHWAFDWAFAVIFRVSQADEVLTSM